MPHPCNWKKYSQWLCLQQGSLASCVLHGFTVIVVFFSLSLKCLYICYGVKCF